MELLEFVANMTREKMWALLPSKRSSRWYFKERLFLCENNKTIWWKTYNFTLMTPCFLPNLRVTLNPEVYKSLTIHVCIKVLICEKFCAHKEMPLTPSNSNWISIIAMQYSCTNGVRESMKFQFSPPIPLCRGHTINPSRVDGNVDTHWLELIGRNGHFFACHGMIEKLSQVTIGGTLSFLREIGQDVLTDALTSPNGYIAYGANDQRGHPTRAHTFANDEVKQCNLAHLKEMHNAFLSIICRTRWVLIRKVCIKSAHLDENTLCHRNKGTHDVWCNDVTLNYTLDATTALVTSSSWT